MNWRIDEAEQFQAELHAADRGEPGLSELLREGVRGILTRRDVAESYPPAPGFEAHGFHLLPWHPKGRSFGIVFSVGDESVVLERLVPIARGPYE